MVVGLFFSSNVSVLSCSVSFSIETGREPLVKTAAHLMKNIVYSNKDQLSAGVIVAGWDPVEGGQVYNVVQGGSCLKQNFCLGLRSVART